MKKRLFEILIDRELADDEKSARAIIMSGDVFVDGVKSDKAGVSYGEDVDITVRQKKCPYVSRGGFKLKEAIDKFNLHVEGKTCIDIGSSTGGFTDCLLKHGAVSVTAVDVGVGELAWSLRNDIRVDVREGVNARFLKREDFNSLFDVAVTDVSFISLKHVLPVMKELTTDDAIIVSLIKPQFECAREEVGEGGIVRDPAVHRSVIKKVKGYGESCGLYIKELAYSPIKGAKGNVEFLALYAKEKKDIDESKINSFIESII